ncbi:hypothetical protein RB195_005426 [Necator americanus]|uniref:ARID domain-containing protein n=1 Tax=Necator americanus TaxID=51031 RepID=A0ABR1BPE7_NECAM
MGFDEGGERARDAGVESSDLVCSRIGTVFHYSTIKKDMSTGDGPPPPDGSGQNFPTPTLNNLLSNKSSVGGDAGLQQDQNVSNGGTPFGADRYAATAAAVAAGAGSMNHGCVPPKHVQLAGVQQQEWQQPRSPIQQPAGHPPPDGQQIPPQPIPQQQIPPQLQPHQTQPHPYAGAYPPHFMQGRPPGYPYYPPGYPGLPPGQPGYPGAGAPVGYPPHMLRPQQQELVRMPQGPTPAEWAAQQQRVMKEANPPTPASIPAPSPAASSVADDSMDDKSRLESPSWANQGQRTPHPPGSQTPGIAQPPMHPGGPPPPGGMMMHPGMMPPQAMMPPVMQPTPSSGPRKESIVDKLVGPPTAANPPRVMPERRMFFERLVQFCEQHGEPITMIPQVSKQNVDLHRLYIGVRNRGGFEQVTKDKAWKAICTEANPEISQSSAAGYQLRKHYEKHLLLLECVETGRRPEDAVAFADGLKRQRRKEPAAAAAGATPTSSLPPFPGPSSQPSQPPPMGARTAMATATWYPQHPQHGSGYLAASVPQARPVTNGPCATVSTYPQPGYPPTIASPSSLKISPNTSPYAQYALNYYHQHSLAREREREAYYRSRSMMPPLLPHQHQPQHQPLDFRPYGPAHGQPQPGQDPSLYYHHQQQQQQAAAHGYPPGAVPSGPPSAPGAYPTPGYPPRLPPGATPMRAPHPQPHMPGAPQPDLSQMDEQQRQHYFMQQQYHQQMAAQHHQQQQAQQQQAQQQQAQQQHQQQQQHTSQPPPQQNLVVPAQTPQPATPGRPGSVQPPTPAALQMDASSQSGSRAPSTGPGASGASPDSSSRMSAGADAADQQRPGSAAVGTPAATPTPGQHPTPQPSTSMAAVGPPGQPAGVPSHASGAPFYGQPAPMYPNGPARMPGAPAGYPTSYPYHPGHAGVPPGHPTAPSQQQTPQFASAPHPAAHPAHPQHQQYLQQQQMWHQRGGYPGPAPGQIPPQAPRYGYAPRMPPPQTTPSQQSASSPGANKMRYPTQPPQTQPALTQQPQQQSYPARAPQIAGSYPPVPPQAAPAPTPLVPPVMSFSHQHHFPHGSVEATVISQKRRRKIMARELINATPRRLIMALRSGLETEAIWAINALNVLLYDDTNPHPCLTQMPGLLNVIIEHFWATLSVLYPETFPLSEPSRFHIPQGNPEALRLPYLTNGSAHEEVKQPVATRNPENKRNYNKNSRTGRKVKIMDAEMPELLKRRLMLEEGPSSLPIDETLSVDYVEERIKLGLGGGLAERVALRLRNEWNAAKIQKRGRFSVHQAKNINSEDCNADTKNKEPVHVKQEPKEQAEEEIPDILLLRRGRKDEMADGPNEFEIRWPRAIALTDRDETLHRFTLRALALSNILRGFSFLPGSEHLLCAHSGLLYVLGRFLQLLSTEKPVQRAKPAPKIEVDAPLPEPESYEVARKRALSLLDCDDCGRVLLVETANQLRDDAFVMLCHMSVALDLFDVPNDLAYPIYDGILHWCASTVPEATDPIPPAAVSPRNYSLEIMCKMSVLERNVDMLLSTGAWPRLEKIVRMLAKMLSMSEETHNREFAIVILNAFCNSSEAVCYVAAMETPTIANLVSFIETSDQSMHQVMQTHGMPALRDNPEMMGTSVGMLRRAAAMLRLLVKVPEAYRVYAKFQQRLLQFTMSQLMDSRVAGMIADALYEIQLMLGKENAQNEATDVANGKHNGDASEVVKSEASNDDTSSSASTDVTSENVTNHDSSPAAINGDASIPAVKKVAMKRSGIRDDCVPKAPASKRTCLENGYEKKNGKLDNSPLKLKETRAENGSMTAVA